MIKDLRFKKIKNLLTSTWGGVRSKLANEEKPAVFIHVILTTKLTQCQDKRKKPQWK